MVSSKFTMKMGPKPLQTPNSDFVRIFLLERASMLLRPRRRDRQQHAVTLPISCKRNCDFYPILLEPTAAWGLYRFLHVYEKLENGNKRKLGSAGPFLT